MPEGHTLHRLANQQTTAFRDRVVAVSSPQGRFAEGAELLDGRRLLRVSAYGKHLFQHYEGRLVTHVHLGLYGKFREGTGEPDPPVGALRLRLETVDEGDFSGPAGAREVLATPGLEVGVLETARGGMLLRGIGFLRQVAERYPPSSTQRRWVDRELRALLGEFRDQRVRRGTVEDRAEAAELLKKRALANEFESLIVVAPPKTLGELRKHYHKEVSRRLIGELDKDLTGHPVPDIEKALNAA